MKSPSWYISGSSEDHHGLGWVSPKVFLPQLLSLVITFPHLSSNWTLRQGLVEWNPFDHKSRSGLRPLEEPGSMGPQEIYSSVLVDKPAVVAKSLYFRSLMAEMSSVWRMGILHPFLKRAKMMSLGITGQSASSPWLARSWTKTSGQRVEIYRR